MLERIIFLLNQMSYRQLDINRDGYYLFFQEENNYINAVQLIDGTNNPQITEEDLEKMFGPMQWRMQDGSRCEVHHISLLITNEPDKYENLLLHNSRCWIIDAQNKQLIMAQNSIADFYGLKDKLINGIHNPFVYSSQPEENEEKSEKKEALFSQLFQKDVIINRSIICINILVFLITVFTGNLLIDSGAREYQLVLEDGQWYRLFTSMFLHGDGTHIFSNMIWLFFLGDIVEQMVGHYKYLIIYIMAGLGGDVFSMIFEAMNQEFVSSIGASGAVFGIEGALLWLLIRNNGKIREMTIPKIIFALVCSLYYGFSSTNIDNAAHIGGLLVGFLLAMLLYRKNKPVEKMKD